MRVPSRVLSIAAGVALATSSCTAAPPPATSPTSLPAPPEPTRTLAAPAANSDEIVVQVIAIPSVSNFITLSADLPSHFLIAKMVHAALYRHDASLTATPDLAAEPCDVADDLVTITCTLRPATFHDGSPVTARDVAYVYELAKSPACFFATCLGHRLRDVEAVDDATVRFTLERPYAPFLAASVADILVEPRSAIEASYQAFADRARERDPEEVEGVAEAIRESREAAEADCERNLELGESMLRALGVEPMDRRLFPLAGGRGTDACAYADHLVLSLEQAVASMRADGMDAVAAAYPILEPASLASLPVGAGPWRLTELDPEVGLVLARHDAYHHGAPETPEVRILLILDDAESRRRIIEGDIDWLVARGGPTDFGELREEPSVRTVVRPAFAYGALQYNVRPGRLFADVNLRRAVELCIDKERIIEAGISPGVPIYSPVPPGSWAYQPGLAKPRDVDAARTLIEASGWIPGDDGIYERGTERLWSAVVRHVRRDPRQERTLGTRESGCRRAGSRIGLISRRDRVGRWRRHGRRAGRQRFSFARGDQPGQPEGGQQRHGYGCGHNRERDSSGSGRDRDDR